MAAVVIPEKIKKDLDGFLQKHKSADLVSTYLFYIEKKHKIKPALFPKNKTIYKSKEDAIEKVEAEGKLWRETHIKIQVGPPNVNEQTRKIYLCPFTGKVFGDNTHPNPQDAIYEWVSKCPENTERVDGIKIKRFFVSEDPEIIKNYIKPKKTNLTKTVYSSAITGKLFNTKESVINDFKQHQLKPIPLAEVPTQNRFQIEDSLMELIQTQLDESKVARFVEAMEAIPEFAPCLDRWLEESRDE